MSPDRMPARRVSLAVPSIGRAEEEAVLACVRSGWVSTAGPAITEFENRLKEITGAGHVIATMNGTSALHLALLAAGIGPGDAVLVPSLTFIATVNAVRYVGAEPVFLDADAYYCMDMFKAAAFLARETVQDGGTCRLKTDGRPLRAVIVTHVFGNAADLPSHLPVFRSRNIAVIEDAAESLGTVYTAADGNETHTGIVGDIGCLSFNGNKIVTTGGGGAVLVNDDVRAARIRYLSTQAKDDALRYVHDTVGYNYRMTSLQAALGLAQLSRLREILDAKQRIWQWYSEGVEDVPGFSVSGVPPYARNNCWMVCLTFDPSGTGVDTDGLMAHFAEHGIETRPIWWPNHMQKPYQDCPHDDMEHTLAHWRGTINVPSHHGVYADDVAYVCDVLHSFPAVRTATAGSASVPASHRIHDGRA
jgi:perosamine synthetase